MVAARGLTPVLRYAMEEARLRQATLYVLFVKELSVNLPGPVENAERPKWQDDQSAAEIMYRMLEAGKQNEVSIVPLYLVSDNAVGTILDLSATLGVDILMLGASHRKGLEKLLKGNVISQVAKDLPESIELVIHG
jgi:nucleotide-binding universal stress UspA family protein